jgi:N-acetylglucosaminyl-diphospho-decaprenol L-rhamnosyltransferase
MKKEVTVILIAHKSRNLILEYIKKIYQKFDIIIVDNSNDLRLTKIIDNKYPEILIKNIENNGYGAAINYGSKYVKTKYFLISNPDLTGIDEYNLDKFVNTAKYLKDDFSVLGPRYLNANPKSLVQSNIKKDIAEWKYISGACMFFVKKKFDSLNGFDENFFLYFEEDDFCLRANKINKNYQINTIKVTHYAGNSVIIKDNDEVINHKYLRSWHFVWSKFYYYKKNYGFIFALMIFTPILIRTRLKILLYKIKNDNENIKKYENRWSGIKTSIMGGKSYKRLDT